MCAKVKYTESSRKQKKFVYLRDAISGIEFHLIPG